MKYVEIMEAFDTKINWTLGHESPNEMLYATRLTDDTYLELSYTTDNDWNTVEASFSRNQSREKTGTGNQMQIFGAVINHIINFVREHRIPKLVFSAHKPQGSFGTRDTGRSDLYKKMAQKYIQGTGYTLTVRDVGNNDVFTLENPSLR